MEGGTTSYGRPSPSIDISSPEPPRGTMDLGTARTLLGVREGASVEEIKRRFRAQLRKVESDGDSDHVQRTRTLMDAREALFSALGFTPVDDDRMSRGTADPPTPRPPRRIGW